MISPSLETICVADLTWKHQKLITQTNVDGMTVHVMARVSSSPLSQKSKVQRRAKEIKINEYEIKINEYKWNKSRQGQIMSDLRSLLSSDMFLCSCFLQGDKKTSQGTQGTTALRWRSASSLPQRPGVSCIPASEHRVHSVFIEFRCVQNVFRMCSECVQNVFMYLTNLEQEQDLYISVWSSWKEHIKNINQNLHHSLKFDLDHDLSVVLSWVTVMKILIYFHDISPSWYLLVI